MKNEHLLDLLENVEEKYIAEALQGYDEYDSSRPVEAHEGKTRITPMKIIAPIAACLAVVAAAGFAASNIGKLAIFAGNSGESVSASVPASGGGSAAVKPPAELAFVEELKELVIHKLKADPMCKVETADDYYWDIGMLDIDFDGEDEYLLHMLNKNNVAPVFSSVRDPAGVYVFKKTAENGAEDLGYFGAVRNISLNKIYRAPDGSNRYYYYYAFSGGTPQEEGILFVSFDSESGQVKEVLGPHCTLVDTYHYDTGYDKIDEYYDEEGVKISRYAFKELWARYPNLPELTIFNTDISYSVREEAFEILSDKYGVSVSELRSSYKEWGIVNHAEGCSEGVLTFDNVPELPDIYVFSYIGQPVKLMGVLEKPGELCEVHNFDYFSDKNDQYSYYHTTETGIINGEERTLSYNIFKVKVAENGTHTSENVLAIGRDPASGSLFIRSGGRDISPEEFTEELLKYNYPGHEIIPLDRKTMIEAGLKLSDFYHPISLAKPAYYTGVPYASHDDYYCWERATFCTAALGDYEISLLGENIVRTDYKNEKDSVYGVVTLFVTLTKNGEFLDLVEITPKGSFFTEYAADYTPVIKDRVDDMLAADEARGTVDLSFFTFDSAETVTFSVENNKLFLLH